MLNYIKRLLFKVYKKFFIKKESLFTFECKDPDCPHCLEDIKQMKEDNVWEVMTFLKKKQD